MTSPVPAVCPTCGTSIPAGRAQCPGCKKVFGEDNRCETCNAIAGVFPRGAGFVCAACSAPRVRHEGTVVLGGARPQSRPPGARGSLPSAAAPAGTTAVRAGGAGLRVLGGASVGGGALGAALAVLLISGPIGFVVGGALGAAGLAFGVLAWRSGGKQNAAAAQQERAAREQAVIALAQQSGGVLTVTAVAQAFGWSAQAADALLTSMADGTRVTVEVDDQGLVSWYFREIMRTSTPRVRVAEEARGIPETRAMEQVDAEALARGQKR